MYTIESMIKINPIYHANHRIQQADANIANKYVEIVEKSRTDDKIQVGDIIELTTSYGDYFKNAHVENFNSEKNEWNICERAAIPFISSPIKENNIRCLTSGGPWSNVPNNLKLISKRKKEFMVFGFSGACANGAIYFEALVNAWEYKQPNPLYGEYTTKNYDRYYISYIVESFGDYKTGEYVCFTNSFTFPTTANYEAWRDTFRGVEFEGGSPNQKVVFVYKRIEKLIT